ncbi:peptidase C39-like protein [Entomoplasma freundtii]|uniref:ABC transporter ATP-binding protein/permease n=1 Tax=Entomoplasma freundtii TaxID=74700 RepID=A0A2K8NT81_9MOLU|nr:cysteine peptidase family C39 domain-containing protein [Entomoplasma freundtii]ATZ16388.1 ABC transporter ATP-binding protein/permease [Entomoplasma freundtii]TDY56573.1 peptidase C39-like protein [Entomoplasma freundtii]
MRNRYQSITHQSFNNYHFVPQESWNDCGFACLAMLIDYFHNQQITLSELKNNYPKLPNEGLSFFDLQKLGSCYKLQGDGYHCDFESLLVNKQSTPIILNILNDLGLKHYVILTRISNNFVWITDPSTTKRDQKITHLNLKERYLGQIFVFQRQGFWKTDWQWGTLKRWTKKNSLFLGLLLGTGLLQNLAWFLSAFFIKIFNQWLILQTINFWELLAFISLLLCGLLAKALDGWLWQKISFQTWTKFWEIWEQNELLAPFKNSEDWQVWLRTANTCWNNLQSFWLGILALINFCLYGPFLTYLIIQNHWMLILPPLFLCLLNNLFNWWQSYKRKSQSSILKTTANLYQKELQIYLENRILFSKRGLIEGELANLGNTFQDYLTKQKNYQLTMLTKNTWTSFCQKFLTYGLFLVIFWLFNHNQILSLDLLYCFNLLYLWFHLTNELTDKVLNFYEQKTTLREFQNLNFFHSKSYRRDNQTSLLKPQKLKSFGWKNWDSLINWNWPPSFSSPNNLQIILSKQQLTHFFATWDKQEKPFTWNEKPLVDYHLKIIYLDDKGIILPGLVCHNLFWKNQNLTTSFIQQLNLDYWLRTYKLTFLTNCDSALTLQQRQLINFLHFCCLEANVYLFNDCLSALPINDQKQLLNLFLKLNAEKGLTIFGTSNLAFGPLGGIMPLREGMV